MNICFLSKEYPPNIIGGVGTYTYDMAHVLAGLGHNVYVITEGEEGEPEYIDVGVVVFRVAPARFPLNGSARALIKGTLARLEYSYAVSKKLAEMVKKYNIDIVESCEARAEAFWYYIFRRNPPLVVKLHTPEGIVFKLDCLQRNLDGRLIAKLEEFWIFKAAKIVAVTEAIIGLVSGHYNIDMGKLPVVYYPVNTELFKPDGASVSKEGNFNILYAGRLEHRKGVHVLIDAIPAILTRYPRAQFFFVGSDAGVKYRLLERIARLGCGENIKFVDQVSRQELIKYYQQSRLCVVPSLWENFAFVALEAMSCGCPVVASAVGGLTEMIDDGVTGLLCPPEDSARFADAVIRLLGDDKLCQTLGANAREKIVRSYNPEKMAAKTLEVYKEVCNRK